MCLRLWGAVLAAALAIPKMAYAQGTWPEDCKLVRMAGLPMTFKAGHVLVQVDVNGQDVQAILDTGGLTSALTKTTVTSLGIVSHRQNTVIISDIGGEVADEYVRVDDFRMGNLRRGGVYLSVMAPVAEAGGLIAPDILRNYDAEFDFGSGNFNLFRYHPCSDHAVYWTGSYAALPFTLMRDGHIRVPVTLDGKDTFAIIDTGAPVSALSMQAAGHLFGLNAASPNVIGAGVLRGGSGGTVQAYAYSFRALTMGGVSVANPSIKLTEGGNFLSGNSAALLLGMDVLSHLHLYIAYHEEKLYITGADAH